MYRRSQLLVNYTVFTKWSKIWQQLEIPPDPHYKELFQYDMVTEPVSIRIYRMGWKLSWKEDQIVEHKLQPVHDPPRTNVNIFDHLILLDGEALFTAFEPSGVRHIRMLPGNVVIAQRNHKYMLECVDADISKHIVFMNISSWFSPTAPNAMPQAYTNSFYSPSLQSLWRDGKHLRLQDYNEMMVGEIRTNTTSMIISTDGTLDNCVLLIIAGTIYMDLEDVQINTIGGDYTRNQYEANTMIIIKRFGKLQMSNLTREPALYMIIRPGGINRDLIIQG